MKVAGGLMAVGFMALWVVAVARHLACHPKISHSRVHEALLKAKKKAGEAQL